MNIGESFPQFIGEQALFVVTGSAEAHLYTAADGVLEAIAAFHVEPPTPSDNEGFFATRSGGELIRSGSVRNDTKERVLQDFLRTLQEHLKKAEQDVQPSKVYVYTPGYVAKGVQEQFSPALKKKIVKVFEGNYAHENPTRLLELLAKEITETHDRLNVPPTSPEAQKILDKTDEGA